jgi:hypothetical protein
MNTRLKKVEEQSSKLLERLSSLESLYKDNHTVPDLIALLRNNTEMLNNVLNNTPPHTHQVHNSHDEEEKKQSEASEAPLHDITHKDTQVSYFRRVT